MLRVLSNMYPDEKNKTFQIIFGLVICMFKHSIFVDKHFYGEISYGDWKHKYSMLIDSF